MEYLILPGGDRLNRDEKSLTIELTGPRRVLSTSVLNGGCREDLCYLFNYCEVYGKEDERCGMRASTYTEHLAILARELAFDPKTTSGLSTAAKMKYAQINSESYRDFTVTAIATAGIDVNGSRAGDPALWHEQDGFPCPTGPGTINLFLFIDASLPAGTLARALVTATEAKTAALQEVLAPSCYSNGLATGSGTDGTIIVSNLSAATCLTDAGQHSKLGEYTGRVVKNTIKQALSAENGFSAYACSSMLRRISRFGLNEESLWEKYCHLGRPGGMEKAVFRRRLAGLDSDKMLSGRASLYAHLLDLLHWELIDPAEAEMMAAELLGRAGEEKKAGQASQNWAVAERLIDRFSHYLIINILSTQPG